MRFFYFLFLSFLLTSCVSVQKIGKKEAEKAQPGPIVDDEFYSKIAGFKLQKPKKWHFATSQEYTHNLERIELDDKGLKKKVLQQVTLPLVVITKYKEPYDDVNPSFKVNIKPLGPMSATKPQKIIDMMVPVLKKMFSDLKVKSKKQVYVAGLKAGYGWFEYTMKTANGKTFSISSEIWVVPKGKHFFLLGSGTKVGDKASRREIKKILKTVKFL